MPERFADDDPRARAGEETAKKQTTPISEPNAFTGQNARNQTRNMTIDPLKLSNVVKEKINKPLNEVSQKEFEKQFEDCTVEEKLKTIKNTLEADGALGLKYTRRAHEKPQTVTEFLTNADNKGNCADFSRLLVAVAKEKGLQVQMLAIIFQAQDGTKEEEQHLAVFNTGATIYYLDLSNNVLRPYSGFASVENLIKDTRFRRDILEDYKRGVMDGREYKIAEEPKIISGESAYKATYWADMGHYYVQKQEWKEAASCYEKAEKLGFKTYWTNAELGAAYSKMGLESEAIKRLGEALKIRSNARIYPYLADAHIGLAQEYNAIGKFDKARKEVSIVTSDPEMKIAYGAAKHLLARMEHTERLKLLKTDQELGIAALNTSIAAYRSAYLYYREGDQNLGILRTGFVNTYHDLVGTYMNIGRIGEAERILGIALIEAKEKHLPIEGLLKLQQEIKSKTE